MLLIAGSGSSELGLKVAKSLGCDILNFESRKFPDGERYIRIIDNCKGEDVCIVQSMYKDPSNLLMEYVLLVDAVVGAGAARVIGVIPYLPYLRQDSRFKSGEALSSKVFVDLLESSATSMIFVVDPHLHRIKNLNMLFNVPAFNISAMPALAEYLTNNYSLNDPLVVAPDEEAQQWASIVARELNVNYVVATKVRSGDNSVEITHSDLDVRGKDIVVVDDIISTGGTLAKITSDIKSLGAGNVIGLVTHGLFAPGAYEKVTSSGMKALITTDTVPNAYSLVSVAPVIAQSIVKELG